MRAMKTQISSSKWLGLIGVCGLSIIAALGIAVAAPATNLLTNGGVNGTYVPQAGIVNKVPAGWTAVNIVGNPTYEDTKTTCGCGGNNEKTEGDNAVYIQSPDIETPPTPGKPFDAVLYQQVSGIVSGTAYGFGAAIVSFCGGTGDRTGCEQRGFRIYKSVGIDPTGGTNPTATTVVWSDENGVNATENGGVTYRGYQDMSVAARAAANQLTVFVRVRWPNQYHGALAFWDAAYLKVAPTATVSVPPTSTGAFSVTWSGVSNIDSDDLNYWNGLKLGFDIQSRVGTSGAWTQLLTTTQLTRTNFAGTPGNTYQFRAQPVLFQQDNPNDAPTRRIVGLFTEPVSATVSDLTPPSSAVSPLPTYTLTTTFTVQWSGTDNTSPPSALRYDVQVRDGAAGAWNDFQTSITATSASYNGQLGHTYYFRSRAYDEFSNVETYPTTPNDFDAFTTITIASVSGIVRNLREQPIALAKPALTPSEVVSVSSNLAGQYSVYVTATGTYSLAFTRSGFGVLPPIGGLTVSSTLTNVDAILPPVLDLAVNGQFETGSLSSWVVSGTMTPTISTTRHSGGFAAALGNLNGGNATLQQSLFLSPTLISPTLSFLYSAQAGVSAPFSVTISNGVGVSTTNPPISGTGWTHAWFDLTPFVSQTITVTFALQQPTTVQNFLLDEVSIGSAETRLWQIYLPLVVR